VLWFKDGKGYIARTGFFYEGNCMEKIRTFIEGFDEKLSGGIPKNHIVLVTGEPGTMKSSLCYYILHNNAKKLGKKGVYITLEQSRESLIEHMKNMGMSPEEVGDKISIVDLALIRKSMEDLAREGWLQIFKMYAQNLKDTMDYELLVLDSLPVLETLASFENPRVDLFHLFEWMRDLEITTFLVSELAHGSEAYGKHGEDFLADGIIHLTMDKVDEITVQRRIRCVKMRKTYHSMNYFTLMFEHGRFQVTRVIIDREI